MGLFGSWLPAGKYGDASLADKLAILGAGLNQHDPDALARVQGGIDSRVATQRANQSLAAGLAGAGFGAPQGGPGLDRDLGALGINSAPDYNPTALLARAQAMALGAASGAGAPAPAAMGQGGPAPAAGGPPMLPGSAGQGAAPAAPGGAPPVDADGNFDPYAVIAQRRAEAPMSGGIGGLSAAPRTGLNVPDPDALMRLAGVYGADPRFEKQAAELQKQAEFYKPNVQAGPDGVYRNLNDRSTIGQKALPTDKDGVAYLPDPTSPSGYKAVAAPGYQQVAGDNALATAQGTATGQAAVGSAPAPGWQLRGGVWVDPGGTASQARRTNVGIEQDAISDHDQVKVDVPGHPGQYTYVSRSSLGGGAPGGTAMVPTPAGSNAARRPTFNIPAAAAPTYGTDTAHAKYQEVDAANRAGDIKSYRAGVPQLASAGLAISELDRLNKAGIGQGAGNHLVQGFRSNLATLGIPSDQLNSFQTTDALKSTLIKGLTTGAGIQVRNQREFQAFMAKLPNGGNTQAANAKIISYLRHDNDLGQKESGAAFKFANMAGGLDGTITDPKTGQKLNWDQVRSEIYRRNPYRF